MKNLSAVVFRIAQEAGANALKEYERREVEGICRSCGIAEVEPGKRWCTPCLDREKAFLVEYEKRRLSEKHRLDGSQ